MLLHLNFCIEWFDSNSKEDSNSFGKCCEKKKKRKNFPFSAFGPCSPVAHRSPAIVSLRAACSSFPRVPLWAEPSERR
jgi:hypothetical protein